VANFAGSDAAPAIGVDPFSGQSMEAMPREQTWSSSWLAITLCFLAVLVDGLDTSSIGVAAPAIAAAFDVPAASLTSAFVCTSIGAVLGYLASGPLVARWQANRILAASVAAFGILSLATPFVESVGQLAALRLITAIGLGAALPAAMSIATSLCPQRFRASVAVVVGTGLAVGGIFGGVLGAALTARFGWQYLFYVGGVLPLALSVALSLCLRRVAPDARSKDAGGGSNGAVGSIPRLFQGGLAIKTTSLWLFSFLIFADGYAFVFWLPSLLTQMGFSPEQSQFGVSFFSAGGLVTNVILMLLAGYVPVARIILSAVIVALVSTLGLSISEFPPIGTWLLVAGIGAGLISSSVGQSALSVAIYPLSLRAHGIGFSAAAGRIGSIVGPAIAGLLVSMGVAPKSIVLVTTLPALLAVLALAPHVRGRP